MGWAKVKGKRIMANHGVGDSRIPKESTLQLGRKNELCPQKRPALPTRSKVRRVRETRRNHRTEGKRWNKVTIRGCSILIHFILQNASQQKVEKPTTTTKNTAREKCFNMFSLP